MNGEKKKKDNHRKGKYKFTDKEVVEKIIGSGGIKMNICKNLGCDRATFDSYLEKRPTIKQAYEDEIESNLDKAESSLMDLIGKKDLGAICFYLKCKGKQRGYVEKQELDLNHKQPPKVELILTAPGTAPEAK